MPKFRIIQQFQSRTKFSSQPTKKKTATKTRKTKSGLPRWNSWPHCSLALDLPPLIFKTKSKQIEHETPEEEGWSSKTATPSPLPSILELELELEDDVNDHFVSFPNEPTFPCPPPIKTHNFFLFRFTKKSEPLSLSLSLFSVSVSVSQCMCLPFFLSPTCQITWFGVRTLHGLSLESTIIYYGKCTN